MILGSSHGCCDVGQLGCASHHVLLPKHAQRIEMLNAQPGGHNQGLSDTLGFIEQACHVQQDLTFVEHHMHFFVISVTLHLQLASILRSDPLTRQDCCDYFSSDPRSLISEPQRRYAVLHIRRLAIQQMMPSPRDT